MNENIPVIIAFGAGVLSFLSPCLLPLVPVYPGYMGRVAACCEPSISPTEGRPDEACAPKEVLVPGPVAAGGLRNATGPGLLKVAGPVLPASPETKVTSGQLREFRHALPGRHTQKQRYSIKAF